MSAPVEVTDATFEAEVTRNDLPVLVDFWAVWCAPCRALNPVLAEIARDYADRLKIAKFNTDENPTMTGQLGIRSLPTLQLWRGGEPVHTIYGAMPKVKLLREIEPFI